nr:hypothetical protein [uncultured Mediterranean phage uvMED]
MPFANFTGTGDGSTKQFSIPFPYVLKDHIVVALANVANTNFTFVNDTTIEFSSISSATSTQETTGAPKSGVVIEISRDTPLTNALVDFVDGSTLTAGDLDTAVLQLLYGIQEAKDEAALGIQRTPQGQDAKSQPIINVSDPTNAQDAVTKAFLERVGSISSTQILDGTIVNADVNASAAIAGTKISPDFGSQNIATSGTVDGRDVSADGTKLDTVETGATADQTNAEIKTAYEANSNTNNFTDALLAKLNAIEANATTDQTISEIKSLIAGSPLDASHLAADSVTSSELAANSVDSSELIDGSIDHSHLSNDCVDGDNIADNSIGAEHLQANSVDSSELVDGSVDTSHLSADCVDATKIADNAIGSEHLQANSVGVSEIADAELSTLAGMQSGTASKLADSTALTSDIADLNQIDGMAKQTTITDDDAKFPTSGAVVDYVAAQIAPIGGLEVIANEDSFPTSQPSSGVVISISDIEGLIINGSGVATNARTTGNGSDNVTINGFPSSLHSKTMAAGLGLMVSSTGSSQTYTYHKLLAKEADVEQLSNDINDFAARYRVGSSNPTSDLDAGDLFFNTSTQKLLVYNSTNSAWEEAQSIGNFFISTFSESVDGSRQDFTVSNAPTNAQQIILSINGVVQKPNSGTSTPSEGFALSGNTVKLAAPPASGSDVFIVVMGSTVNIGTPSNNTVTSAILQNGSVINSKLGDQSVTLDKLLHGDSNSNGKFLRANNGADPTFESVITDLVNDTSPQLGGQLDTNGNDIVISDGEKLSLHSYADVRTKTGATNAVESGLTGHVIQNSLVLDSDQDIWLASSGKKITFGSSDSTTHEVMRVQCAAVGASQHGFVNLNYVTANAGQSASSATKLATTATGVTVTGTVAATSYTGNGANLTGINTDLVSDTSPQLGGALDTNGSNINFGDSTGNGNTVNRLTFGTLTHGDLQIYHDGSNSYITDRGTGELRLYAAEVMRIRDTDSGEDMAEFNKNGNVRLFYNNQSKFSTESNGATTRNDSSSSVFHRFTTNGGTARGYVYANSSNEIGFLDESTNWHVTFNRGGSSTLYSDWVPDTNNSKDLGSTSARWRNIYTNDLNLSNEGGANDVDGTWGSYTIQEGAEDLFLVNKRNGKKYKFALTEVS